MLLKSFRYLLLPFSLIYGCVIVCRNWLYNRNILKSTAFNFPLICVGNIALGGTGKTPMTEYLVRLLKKDFKPATLSRGYKRKTRGFGIADDNTTALEIGDEPMQFHLKFPDVTIAVGEERLVAIPQLLQERPETEVIILDDAFQHRQVKAGLNILLTSYRDLYTRDFLVPAGDLRDTRSSAERASIIMVTKCRPDLDQAEQAAIIEELNIAAHQSVYFTRIDYGLPYHLVHGTKRQLLPGSDILLVCGIANPTPLKEMLASKVNSYDMLRYNDHHIFDSDDLSEIKKQFEKMKSPDKFILTTEKDGVRMQKFAAELAEYPVYIIPIEHQFLFNEGEKFDSQINQFVHSFKK